jgi:hypothetical protein
VILVEFRVARWFVFWNQKSQLWSNLEGLGIENIAVFQTIWINFTAIWYNLHYFGIVHWSFGIFFRFGKSGNPGPFFLSIRFYSIPAFLRNRPTSLRSKYSIALHSNSSLLSPSVWPGANPTTACYNASVVNFYSAVVKSRSYLGCARRLFALDIFWKCNDYYKFFGTLLIEKSYVLIFAKKRVWLHFGRFFSQNDLNSKVVGSTPCSPCSRS